MFNIFPLVRSASAMLGCVICVGISDILRNCKLYHYDKREFRIVLLRFRILEGGGLKILKTWRGEHRKFTNNLNRGPVKIWAFFKTSSSTPPPPLSVINVLSLNNNTIIFVFAHSGPLVCGKFKCDCKQTINIWSSLVTSILSGELIRKKIYYFQFFTQNPEMTNQIYI
jgi:hypothetical protein